MAAVLNAASNALNQIYDLEIDRVNKPKRPLHVRTAVHARSVGLHLVSVRDRADARLAGRAGADGTSASGLSSPPRSARSSTRCRRSRTKRLGIWANLTIAIPRGVLLKVAGWSSVKTVARPRAVVHRRDLRPLPARRVDDEGFRRHGRGRARRLPDAADHLRRAPRGLDDLAVVRRPVPDDLGGRLDATSSPATPPAAVPRRSS